MKKHIDTSSVGVKTFNLTTKAWAGQCQELIVRLNDSTDHLGHFQFK